MFEQHLISRVLPAAYTPRPGRPPRYSETQARQALTFLVSIVGIALLYTTLWKYEMAAKNARSQVRRLRRTLLGEDTMRPVGRSAAPS